MNMNNVKEAVKPADAGKAKEETKIEEGVKATEETKTDDSNLSLEQVVAKLKAENAALKAANTGTLSLKVSQKGAVSAYGLGRFPVTLYKRQWDKLIAGIEKVKVFIADHESELSVKESSTKVS